MPHTKEGYERVARLEVQMENLTKELEEAKDAIKELTTALNQVRGGLKLAIAFGSFCTAAIAAIGCGLWTVGTWLYDKLGVSH
ncbi:MAG: hypothetical protein K2X87_25475 [Gemmataceae bacterium]|nr:hypothetical protein [Gemmataceae bacterium]